MKAILLILCLTTCTKAMAAADIYVIGHSSAEEHALYQTYAGLYDELLQVPSAIVIIHIACRLPEGVLGLTHQKIFNVNDRPVVVIRLNKLLTAEERLMTLAHEMIHADQYCSGHLRHIRGMMYKWKERNVIDLLDMPYLAWPWEVEARLKDKQLYKAGKRLFKSRYEERRGLLTGVF
jgi:hypothetical protein